MENPNKKLTLVSIRSEHAGEEVDYADINGCALHRALTEAGFNVFGVGGEFITLTMADDSRQEVKLMPGFAFSDFRAVRAGRTVEYLYDEGNKTMTRVNNEIP